MSGAFPSPAAPVLAPDEPGPPRVPAAGALVRATVAAAVVAGDSRLNRHIAALWAAKSDPEGARALLAVLAVERRTIEDDLIAARDPEWWSSASAEQIGAVIEGARVWSRSDPDCDELARLFASELRVRFGIDVGFPPSASPDALRR